MERIKRKPFDSTAIGFLTGFLIPAIIFFVVFLFKKTDISFKEYLHYLSQLNALMKLASLCVFANILFFMWFIRMKYDRAARGVLGATIIYALIILISKAF
jgi:hypothetical protein